MTLVPTVNTNGGATVSFDLKLTPGQTGRTDAIISSTSTEYSGVALIYDNGQIYFQVWFPSQCYEAPISFTVDANFHNFAFKVDPSGNAEWIRDGIVEMEQPSFPTTLIMNLELETFTSSSPGPTIPVGDAWVDNVEITSP